MLTYTSQGKVEVSSAYAGIVDGTQGNADQTTWNIFALINMPDVLHYVLHISIHHRQRLLLLLAGLV